MIHEPSVQMPIYSGFPIAMCLPDVFTPQLTISRVTLADFSKSILAIHLGRWDVP